MLPDRGSPAPGLGALPSVVTLSPHAASSMSPSPTPAKDTAGQVLTRARLQDLVREIDPSEQLDEEVSNHHDCVVRCSFKTRLRLSILKGSS